jgi:hypothetical protein
MQDKSQYQGIIANKSTLYACYRVVTASLLRQRLLNVAEIDCVQFIKIFCYCSASGWNGKELIVSTLHFTLDGEKL